MTELPALLLPYRLGDLRSITTVHAAVHTAVISPSYVERFYLRTLDIVVFTDWRLTERKLELGAVILLELWLKPMGRWGIFQTIRPNLPSVTSAVHISFRFESVLMSLIVNIKFSGLDW